MTNVTNLGERHQNHGEKGQGVGEKLQGVNLIGIGRQGEFAHAVFVGSVLSTDLRNTHRKTR